MAGSSDDRRRLDRQAVSPVAVVGLFVEARDQGVLGDLLHNIFLSPSVAVSGADPCLWRASEAMTDVVAKEGVLRRRVCCAGCGLRMVGPTAHPGWRSTSIQPLSQRTTSTRAQSQLPTTSLNAR